MYTWPGPMPRFDAGAPRFWIDNGSWVAKFVVAHLIKRGWAPATDGRGRFDSEAATDAFLASVDFCFVRLARRFADAPVPGAADVAAPTRRGGGGFAAFAAARSPAGNERAPAAGRVVNHFSAEDALTCKARLGIALEKHVADPKHPATCVCARHFSEYNFTIVGGSLDRVLARGRVAGDESSACVIVKPSRGACGRGIRVFRLRASGAEASLEHAFHRALRTSYGDATSLTVQAYIAAPMLWGDGRKFDVRCYLLLLSLPTDRGDGLAAYYHEGYVRAAGRDYPGVGAAAAGDGAVEELDKYLHITNNSFQKGLANFDYDTYKVLDGRELRIPWERLPPALGLDPNAVDALFMDAIRDAVGAALAGDATPAVWSPTRPKKNLADGWRRGQFAFLGVDFILGDDGRPYLIEFSKSPGVRDVPAFLGVQNTELMADLLDLVLAARTHWAADPAAPPAALDAALARASGSWRRL